MDDACVRGHDAQVAQGVLAPLEEPVSLLISLVFQVSVDLDGGLRTVRVDLDRVVDHEFDRLERIDFEGIAPKVHHRVPHRCEVHHARHAREVLQEGSGGGKRDLLRRRGSGVPVRNGLDVLRSYVGAVFGAEQVFEEDSDRIGQLLKIETAFFQLEEAKVAVFLAANREDRSGFEAVHDALARSLRQLGATAKAVDWAPIPPRSLPFSEPVWVLS
ncbi:MAG: hypothetical protein CNCCGFBP_01901 [Fimbriimonadaceae bacterium]|nr:hypothetical protein [Fimbriimonadaceae bacterium]